MPHRTRRPNLDEKFSLPEDTDPDEVLRRLLKTPDDATPEAEPKDDDSA